MVVLGEAGIGKSRLLEAAVDRARAAGMAVLTGRAVAGGGAYRAVAAALAGHLRDRSPADEELRPFLPALRRLLPAWTPDGDGPDRVDEADPTVVLGEGVLRLLRPLAAERGCLLALEDLHWADADTVALVEYLADAAASTGLLLVVSARDDGPRGAALGRLAGAVVLRPQRLTAAETAALAAAHAADLPADRLELVVAAADGLPLLVEELVRQGRPGVPPTFAALVEQRLADLDDDAAVVLRAAAVLGVDPPWTLLPQVADRPEPVVSAGLRAAVDAGLLVAAGGELRWRHALTCDAVAATALPPERAATARRAADVLLARGSADDARGGGAAGRRGRGRAGGDAPVPGGPPGPRARGAAQRRGAARPGARRARRRRRGRPGGAADPARPRRGRARRGGARAARHDRRRARRAVPAAGPGRRARRAVDSGRWATWTGPAVPRIRARRCWRPTPRSGPVTWRQGRGVLAAEAIRRRRAGRRRRAACARRWSWWRAAPSRTATWRAAAASFGRAASVAAEHGLLKQQVEAEFGRGLLAQVEAGWRPELLARPRELALEAGMLADVARIDLIVADGVLAADGPAAAEPLAEACVALTGALRLSSLQAVMQMILAVVRAALG